MTMAINMNNFLDEHARYCLSILNVLDLRKTQYTSVELLVEILGISKFKVTNYLVKLEKDLKETTDTKMIHHAKGELEIEGLTTEVIRKIRLLYLKQSEVFLLFHEMVCYGTTPEKFANKFFLSRSKAYTIKKELADVFDGTSIEISEGRFIGEESEIRKVFFEVYHFFFNGFEFPFDLTIREKEQEIFEVVRSSLNLESILTRMIKLEIFLAIVYIRIKQKMYIQKIDVVFDEEALTQLRKTLLLVENKLNTMTKIPSAYHRAEQDWLILFLISEECIPFKDYQRALLPNERLYQLSGQQKETFFNGVALDLQSVNQKEVEASLFSELILVNFKLWYSNQSRVTFVSEEQKQYFAEVYPQFHSIALAFLAIAKSEQSIRIEQMEEAGIYYDYMFAIISSIPQRLLKDKVYVCVDFSRGESYSEFISQNILAFQGLNIVIQKKVSNQTQIYVSDFMLDKLNCEQIIWKNPPTDEDWLLFGDSVVKVRNR